MAVLGALFAVLLATGFEAAFFALVGAVSQFMLGALVWWAVLIGNLLASVAMIGYLLRAHSALPRGLIGSWAGVLREGVVAGLIGAAVVAVWFLALDLIRGEPLRTPAVLASGFFRLSGGEGILLYTAAHGLAFIVFGIFVFRIRERFDTVDVGALDRFRGERRDQP